MLKDWLNEVTENDIIERYGTTPGQLQEIINKAIWINHCTQELIKTTKKSLRLYKEYSDLELRLKYGIKKELLPLVELRNIGRVRARKLFNSGITGIGDIKKNPEKFLQIIGRVGLEALKELKIEIPENYRDKKEDSKISDF